MISEHSSNSDVIFYEKSLVDTKRILSQQSYFPRPIERLLIGGLSLKQIAAEGHV